MIVRGINLNGIILVFISRSLRILIEPSFFFISFVLMMSTFTAVIGVFKDIPDIEGDRLNKVWTLAVRYGPYVMVNACVAVLTSAYFGFFIYGLFLNQSSIVSSSLSTKFLSWAHCLLALVLVSRLFAIEYGSKKSVTALYMFIWKLFYIEYLIFPIALFFST
jgi:homogentisate phytyltransferase/homogentisate geranylgeranyltransferase